MTRIGRCRIGGPGPLLAMRPPARQSRPAQNFPNPRPFTLTLLDPQAFLKWHSGIAYIRVNRYAAPVQLASVRCLQEEPQIGRVYLRIHFPEISESTAQRYMKIDRDNPNAARVRDLKFDSVRKHCLSLAPPKERQVMQGDAKDTPAPHYLTFVNNFSKWHRQVQIGQAFVVLQVSLLLV
jgi:hypothetical protein